MMERDAIERLAIDSAAGELSEDGQSLFEAYLAEHAQAKQWAEAMLRMYRQTEAAISSKIGCADTGIPSVSIQNGAPLLARWRPALRWAAIVCVAALLGVGAGRWAKSPVLVVSPERMMGSAHVSAAPQNSGSERADGSFWRAKALAMFEPRPYRERTAAMQAGGLWRKYEHYIKEKYHE